MKKETMKGAEAEVEIRDEKVLKKRPEKEYRNRELDERLREERTHAEKKFIKEARRHNVNAPETGKTDAFTLEMDKIEGKLLKEVIDDKPGIVEQLGKNVAYLHSTDIIHGDLTTSNAISTGEEIFLIDFGLAERSERIEDKAVDIHLLKQVMKSSHPEISEESWKRFQKGYREYEQSEKVLKQLGEVESRGRYK